MLDFYKISAVNKKGITEVYPEFIIKHSKDLMILGGDFYAFWDERIGLWNRDEMDLVDYIDNDVRAYAKTIPKDLNPKPKLIQDAASGIMEKLNKYMKQYMRDSNFRLDEKITYLNTETKREDHVSKRLPYAIQEGPCEAYQTLMNVLYSPKELAKIEWAIGSILYGDSVKIQKFLVFYGSSGTGKSTVLNIIQKLFEGYYAVFDAARIASRTDSFALEAFGDNPLVAIQHDGDLSKIETNTRLNSIVSHEEMKINEKFKKEYVTKFNSFLFMGTNEPVKITNAKSGMLRRLIVVEPTGQKIPLATYNRLMGQIGFELGQIAYHCLEFYKAHKHLYDNYIPTNMLDSTNDFYDFMLENYDLFASEENDPISAKRAFEIYKNYTQTFNIQYPLSYRAFRNELKNYYQDYIEKYQDQENKTTRRSIYIGFLKNKFDYDQEIQEVKIDPVPPIKFKEQKSLLDEVLANEPAQYGSEQETPVMKWDNVKTKLKDIDTKRLHYVRVPKNHIVIDFDLKDKNGEKSYKKNLEAASKFPPTYAELSKSGKGIHLHYIYDGDVDKLSRIYEDDIEIKVFKGKSSLRRKLSLCNDKPIGHISSGLPLKGEVTMVNFTAVKSEKGLRELIKRNLHKEIHGATKPSIDFIKKILDDAYADGLKYDVSDMEPDIIMFASMSSHNSDYCLKVVQQMKFKSDEPSKSNENYIKDDLVFFDVEVYPNLFGVVWKTAKSDPIKMINPSPEDIEKLCEFKLVGFNCRRYDNHILYGRIMGYDNAQLFNLSQKLIADDDRNSYFGEAWNISYTDIYDFCSKKQSLKKWEIELGIHHVEMEIPWDEPVPDDMVSKVMDYCANDVIATQAVFEARKGDWTGRQILADLAESNVNSSTNSLTTKIIFGNEKHPALVYTDLSREFPGYKYIEAFDAEDRKKHNMYRGEDVGFGGYVYAQPGMYENVITFDVSSMHPSSIIALNMFGDYTKNFKDILDARILIKHKEFDKAKKMLNGKLAKYLEDESQAKDLAQALKIAINSVYGLTAANFDNPFRDPRNKNNIVALRGALFMVNLRDEVTKLGCKVVHIKTDSIKVVNPSPEVQNYILDYGKKYGYNFEIESKFKKICLVNDAVYVAKCADDDPESPGEWTATGAQFAVPYVFKKLFTKEPIIFDDMCETKSVKTAIYLDNNENLPDGEHDYIFVGKVGEFTPMVSGSGGGLLMRKNDSGTYSAVVGTKGYRWMESNIVRELHKEALADESYYIRLTDEALETMREFGDVESFIAN